MNPLRKQPPLPPTRKQQTLIHTHARAHSLHIHPTAPLFSALPRTACVASAVTRLQVWAFFSGRLGWPRRSNAAQTAAASSVVQAHLRLPFSPPSFACARCSNSRTVAVVGCRTATVVPHQLSAFRLARTPQRRTYSITSCRRANPCCSCQRQRQQRCRLRVDVGRRRPRRPQPPPSVTAAAAHAVRRHRHAAVSSFAVVGSRGSRGSPAKFVYESDNVRRILQERSYTSPDPLCGTCSAAAAAAAAAASSAAAAPSVAERAVVIVARLIQLPHYGAECSARGVACGSRSTA